VKNPVGKYEYFDATFLEYAHDLRGIPQVIFQLIRLLVKEPAFTDFRFIAFPGKASDCLKEWGVAADRIELIKRIPVLGRYERFHGLFSTFRYRRIIAKARLIIHGELRSVVRAPVPQIVIYYDFIIFEKYASARPRKWMRYLAVLYKNRQAAKVGHKIAISEFTRKRALEIFPAIDPASVTSLPIGIRMPPSRVPRSGPEAGDGLNFLYVGSYEDRKNIPALVDHLKDVAGGRAAVLRLAGRMSAATEAHLRALITVRTSSQLRVEVLGLIPEPEIAGLYAAADFLLFPSLFEGFGLPMVEAMGQGVVVCAFRNSCLGEIGGDAAIMAADNDFAAWGRAIADLCAEPGAYRKASGLSLERARIFTEERMHERYREYLLSVLREAGEAR
jgi:glycosyltransferase involved in cell wall biosynthesis